MLFQKLLGTNASEVAIQYVGGRTQSFVGITSNVTVSLTSLTGGLASAPAAGDIVIVYFATGSNTDRNLVVAGYQEIADIYGNATTNDSNLVVACKTMGATPDTSFVLTGGTLSTADAGTVSVQVFRNVTNPLPSFLTSIGDTTNPNPPSITPLVNNSVIVAGGGQGHASGTLTFTSSDLTNFISVGASDTYASTVGMGYKELASGSFDPATFGGGSPNASNGWTAVTLALSQLYSASGYISQTSGSYTNSDSDKILSLPRPNGTQPNDLLVAVVTRSSSTGTTGIPSGWTRRLDVAGGVVATKIATDTETGTYQFTASGSEDIRGAIFCYRNFDFDVIGSAVTGTANTTIATSITASSSDSIVLGVVVATGNLDSISQSTYFSGNKIVEIGSDPELVVFSKSNVASGATGDVAFTTFAISGGGTRGVTLLALKPI